jgi:hypothetical protein
MADNVSDEDLIHEYKEFISTSVYTNELYRQHLGTIGELRKACGFKLLAS